MQRTLISANSFAEPLPSPSGFVQVSQSFGFAPKFLFPDSSPGWRKISSNWFCSRNRYLLLSRNDRRTMAVETTKSKKRVDRNVNLRKR